MTSSLVQGEAHGELTVWGPDKDQPVTMPRAHWRGPIPPSTADREAGRQCHPWAILRSHPTMCLHARPHALRFTDPWNCGRYRRRSVDHHTCCLWRVCESVPLGVFSLPG